MIPLSLILKFVWVVLFVILLIGAVIYECIKKFSNRILDSKTMKPFAIAYIVLFVIDVVLAIVSDFV